MKKIEFETILEDFNFLENWEDKYRYIIDLGKELENYPEKFKNEDVLSVVQVKFGLIPKYKMWMERKVFSF